MICDNQEVLNGGSVNHLGRETGKRTRCYLGDGYCLDDRNAKECEQSMSQNRTPISTANCYLVVVILQCCSHPFNGSTRTSTRIKWVEH